MTIADSLRHLGPATPDARLDGELVRRFATSRDDAAFGELLRRHGPTVYGVCRRILGNHADAEDAFQATFLVLACKAGSLHAPGLVGNWLYGVAVRTATKARVQSAKRAAGRFTPSGGLDSYPARVCRSSEGDALALIDVELAGLPEQYRAAFVACDLNGRSRSEAARALGWPEGTVAARLAKARELLAARLRQQGMTLGIGLFAGVAVPSAVAQHTLRVVREFMELGTAAAIAPAAHQLASEVLRTMINSVTKWLTTAGVLMATLTLGAVLLAASSDPPANPNRQPAKASNPKVGPAMWTASPPILLDGGERINSLAVAPSGKYLAVTRDGKIDFLDAATRKHVVSMNVRFEPNVDPNTAVGTTTAIAFRPVLHPIFGDVFAVTHKHGVKVGTINLGLMADLGVPVDGIPPNWWAKDFDPHQVTWLAEDGLAMTNGERMTDRLRDHKEAAYWELAGGKLGRPILLAALPGQSRFFLTSGNTAKEVNEIQIVAQPPLSSPQTRLVGHKARPVAGAVAKDGKRLVTGDEGGTVLVWEGAQFEFQQKSRFELGEGILQLALAPDGNTVAVVRGFEDTHLLGRSGRKLTTLTLHVFDITDPTAQPKPLWKSDQPILGERKADGPASLAFSQDGTTLFAAFGDPYIRDSDMKSRGIQVWNRMPKQ